MEAKILTMDKKTGERMVVNKLKPGCLVWDSKRSKRDRLLGAKSLGNLLEDGLVGDLAKV